MTRAREQLIILDETPYFHCISRVVRRSFLCGQDSITGNNYEHRRSWFIERLHDLNLSFSIDVCAYAIMSNHSHLVLRVDRQSAKEWSSKEVVERWGQLFSIPPFIQEYFDKPGDILQSVKSDTFVKVWKRWVMSCSMSSRCVVVNSARHWSIAP